MDVHISADMLITIVHATSMGKERHCTSPFQPYKYFFPSLLLAMLGINIDINWGRDSEL